MDRFRRSPVTLMPREHLGDIARLTCRVTSAARVDVKLLERSSEDEASLGPLLLWRRARAPAIVVACILHAGLELTMHPDVFGWQMVAMLFVFWPTRDPAPTSRTPHHTRPHRLGP